MGVAQAAQLSGICPNTLNTAIRDLNMLHHPLLVGLLTQNCLRLITPRHGLLVIELQLSRLRRANASHKAYLGLSDILDHVVCRNIPGGHARGTCKISEVKNRRKTISMRLK